MGEIKKKIQNKIYSNQKFEDQIWYNQQITWCFKIFHNFWKVFFIKYKRKFFFLETKLNFFDWKVFLTLLIGNKYKKFWK